MKNYFILFISICIANPLRAQETYISRGKIEYERKTNVYKQLESLMDNSDDGSWLADIKKACPPVSVSYFDLYFDGNKSLYRPGKENTDGQKTPEFVLGPAHDNSVYHDLSTMLSISQKNVFEGTFLIQDSIRKISWQLTFDKRTIAGFECRKAVAKILDSVYVIAFYTEDIITSSGPESFSGLPGMILGLAIPRLNTSWFATKLELLNLRPEDLNPPKQGKKVSLKEITTLLKPIMKDWGKFGPMDIIQVML